jgi:hypothetical protein
VRERCSCDVARAAVSAGAHLCACVPPARSLRTARRCRRAWRAG